MAPCTKESVTAALLQVVRQHHRCTDTALASIFRNSIGNVGERKANEVIAEQKLEGLDRCAIDLKVRGVEDPFVIVKPALLLQDYVDKSPRFAQFLWEAISVPQVVQRQQVLGTRANPLGVLLFEDGAAAGNVLDAGNRRKFSAWHWSLQQFYRWFRSRDIGWFPCAAPLLNEVEKLSDGKATFCKYVLREFWIHQSLADGISVDFGLWTVTIYFKYEEFIADVDSHRECWGWVGASGTKPCPVCKNVYHERGGAELADGYLAPHSCSVFSKFDRISDDEIYHGVDALSALVQKAQFKYQVTRATESLGIRHMPSGPLMDLELRPHIRPARPGFDGMHVWFGHGIVEQELELVMGCAKDLEPPVFFGDLNAFCCQEGLRFPGHGATTFNPIKNLFVDKKVTQEGKPRMWATECLEVVPLIRSFAERVLDRHEQADAMRPQIASLKACCAAAVARVRFSKHDVESQASYLDKHSHYLELRHVAYDPLMLPKHHYGAHLEGGVDCFPLERKHKIVVCPGTAISSAGPRKWSRHVLGRAVLQQLAVFSDSADSPFQRSHLLPPTARCDELSTLLGHDARVSEKAALEHVAVRADDVVQAICRMRAGKLCR